MPLDLQNPLAGSSAAVMGLLYVGASLYVTGPLVGERTIVRSGWEAQCLEFQDVGRTTHLARKPDCKSLMGLFGIQGREICEIYGNPALDLLTDPAGWLNLNPLAEEHRTRRVMDGKSRCACAVSSTLDRRRMSFALYAGTARLVTPAPVRNLPAELRASLRSPPCASASNQGGDK